jgi:NAD(P)-dependent dehydrogenase (short-subunit alcohol dehydrogenase family)
MDALQGEWGAPVNGLSVNGLSVNGLSVDLDGVTAVVTGASRGAGRAIAIVLAEAGATVYASARTVFPSEPGREDTLEETAQAARRRGGTVLPVRCDHTVERDVEQLFERVRREQGRLDLLVNNAWGGYEQRRREPEVAFFDAPFWEQPLWRWEGMFDAGVRAHFLASRYGAPLLMRHSDRQPGLIVHTIAWAFGSFLGNVLYDTAKAATIRLAFGSAEQLRPFSVAAVALAPGHLGVTETPEYVGRAVATLAADPDVMEKTGATLTVGELAREYGFTDIDGSQPESWGLPTAAVHGTG